MVFSVSCKTGKLQVDETTVQQVTGKTLVWSAPREAVTRIDMKRGKVMADLVIHVGEEAHAVPFVGKIDADKFLTFFPGVEVGAIVPPAPVPVSEPKEAATQTPPKKKVWYAFWYEDPDRLTYIATYTNEKTMQKEVEAAAHNGWMPQGTTTTGSHINVGRTMTKLVLPAGLGLMTGASRSKEKITITFVRTPEWTAQNHERKG